MPEIKNLAPARPAGHAPAGAKADAELTFRPDHQAGPGQEGTVMAQFTRRSVLRGSLGVAAAGVLARPYIANAAATKIGRAHV